MPEIQSFRPSIIEDARSYLGLNYTPPKGTRENLAEIAKIPGDIRNGLMRIMNLGNL